MDIKAETDGCFGNTAASNNEKFTTMFNENASYSDAKNLITLVRSNNIIAQNDRDGLGYIYIILNGTQLNIGTYKEYTQAENSIKNGLRYSINTPNNKNISEATFIGKNNEYNAKDKELSAAYYYNGYLRVISIDEVK